MPLFPIGIYLISSSLSTRWKSHRTKFNIWQCPWGWGMFLSFPWNGSTNKITTQKLLFNCGQIRWEMVEEHVGKLCYCHCRWFLDKKTRTFPSYLNYCRKWLMCHSCNQKLKQLREVFPWSIWGWESKSVTPFLEKINSSNGLALKCLWLVQFTELSLRNQKFELSKIAFILVTITEFTLLKKTIKNYVNLYMYWQPSKTCKNVLQWNRNCINGIQWYMCFSHSLSWLFLLRHTHT